ncbi:hypothetical protein ABW19_dt0205645 [Dactylella cylindrospora]|nr:hypothetical protein ABW19_dt0205645 [Dactylella cylindrospora]
MAEKWEPLGGLEVRPGVYHKQNFALAVVAGTPLISLSFTMLRLWAKRRSGWGADDYTVIFAASNVRLPVTAIGAVKIYETYQDRLYVSAPDDWTWDIIFTINHWENCVAIVVACIPSLRVLILRWLGKEEAESRVTGASPIRITGGNPASAGATQKSARESFMQRLRPPNKKRGLYDTTIGDHTIDLDLERCAGKTTFDETVMEDQETASCSSKAEVAYYSRSESVSTTNMNDIIEKPEKVVSKN